jgi:hypothetical protein
VKIKKGTEKLRNIEGLERRLECKKVREEKDARNGRKRGKSVCEAARAVDWANIKTKDPQQQQPQALSSRHGLRMIFLLGRARVCVARRYCSPAE